MRVGREEPVNMYIVKLIRPEWCVCVSCDGLVVCPDYSSSPLTAEVGVFAPVMLVLNFTGVKKSCVITFYLHKFAEPLTF